MTLAPTRRSFMSTLAGGFVAVGGARTLDELSTALAAPAVGDNVRVRVSYKTLNLFGGIVPLPNNGVVSQSAYARLETKTTKVVACP